MQYLVEIGARQRSDVGEALQEALEIGNNRSHLGLLQHDLRYPNAIRLRRRLPRQVFAPFLVEPGEQSRAEGGCTHGCARVSSMVAEVLSSARILDFTNHGPINGGI